MAISIISNGPKRERELIESLAYYCVDKLLPRKKNLEIDIKQIRDLETKEGDTASCIDTDNLNTFDIKLEKNMSLRKKLLSVAHEMVHVKQFTRKELEHTEWTGIQTWLGKRYNTNKTYWELPWEIEAYGRELGLFNRWVHDHNIVGSFTKDPT